MGNQGMNGSLQIQFTKNRIVAGQSLEGRVVLKMNMDVPPCNLTLTVSGEERGHFIEQQHKNARNSGGKRREFQQSIIEEKFVLCSFDEGLKKGTHVKQFTIDLPAWLPASLRVAPANNAEFFVEYKIKAKFAALLKSKNKQCIKNEQVFWIQRPYQPSEADQQLSVDFSNKVGGLLGFGKTECNAKVKFSENQLYAGAIVKSDIDLDNSTCKNDIDYIQLYLIQTVKTMPNGAYQAYHMETSVGGVKAGDLNIPAKSKKQFNFAMDMPMSLNKSFSRDKSPLFLNLTPSFSGKNLVVTYELELTIKHKGWNTEGQGNAVTLPVWINSSNPAVRATLDESKKQFNPNLQTPTQVKPEAMQGPPQGEPVNAYPTVTADMIPQAQNPYGMSTAPVNSGFSYPDISAPVQMPVIPMYQNQYQMPPGANVGAQPQDQFANGQPIYGVGVDGNQAEIEMASSGFVGYPVMNIAFSNPLDGYSNQNNFSQFNQQPVVCQERGENLSKENQE